MLYLWNKTKYTGMFWVNILLSVKEIYLARVFFVCKMFLRSLQEMTMNSGVQDRNYVLIRDTSNS